MVERIQDLEALEDQLVKSLQNAFEEHQREFNNLKHVLKR